MAVRSAYLLAGRWGVRRVAGLFRLTSVVVRGLFWVIARPVARQEEDRDHYL